MGKLFNRTAILVATGASIALGVLSLPKIKKVLNKSNEESFDDNVEIISDDNFNAPEHFMNEEITTPRQEKSKNTPNEDITEELVVVNSLKEQQENFDTTDKSMDELNLSETKVKLKDLSKIAKRRMENFSQK